MHRVQTEEEEEVQESRGVYDKDKGSV